MRISTPDMASLLVVALLTIGQAFCYPHVLHQQRKADPFVALANTLRQEQEQEALQQQQQRLDSGYYYDYGHEAGPSDDDLYQMAQFQRQLSRAAVAPFFGRAQRGGGSWGQVSTLDDGQYGYPVEAEDNGSIQRLQEEEEEEPMSEWYDQAMDNTDRSSYDVDEAVKEQQEGQLLLNMLAEYMLMYGSAGGQQEAGEESKRGSMEKNVTEAPMTTTSTPTTITAAAEVQEHHPEKQPPVRKGQDGTPLGQQEFPMMRPATPQRNQWLAAATSHMLQGHRNNNGVDKEAGNKKRHHKKENVAKKSSIVTPEDKLIEELDNLKMKKN